MRYLFSELPPDLQAQLGELSRERDNPQVFRPEGVGAPAALVVVGAALALYLVWFLLGKVTATSVGAVALIAVLLAGGLTLIGLGVLAILRTTHGPLRPCVALVPPLLVRTGTAAEAVELFRLDEIERDVFLGSDVVFVLSDGLELRFRAGPDDRTFFRAVRAAAEAARARTAAGSSEVHPWERLLPREGRPAAARGVGARAGLAAAAAVPIAFVLTVACWTTNARAAEGRLWAQAEREPQASERYAAYLSGAEKARASLPGPIFGATQFGAREDQAREREDDLSWSEQRRQGSVGPAKYLEAHPGGRHVAEARQAIDDARFVEARISPLALRKYLADLPKGLHVAEVHALLEATHREWEVRLSDASAKEDARPLRGALAAVLARAREAREAARLTVVVGSSSIADSRGVEAELRALIAAERLPSMEEVLKDTGSVATIGRNLGDEYTRSQRVLQGVKAAFDHVPEGLFELDLGGDEAVRPRLKVDSLVLPSGEVYESTHGALKGLNIPGAGNYYPGIVVAFAFTLELPDGTSQSLELLGEPGETLSVEDRPAWSKGSLFQGPDADNVYQVMFTSAVVAMQGELQARLR